MNRILKSIQLIFLTSLAINLCIQPSSSQIRQLPDDIRVIPNITYAVSTDGQPLKLDLYLPQKSPAQPPALLVWIHGGGWTKGDKTRVNPNFIRLVPQGYAVASINYSLDGLQSYPRQIHECKAAIRFLRAKASHYNYSTRRIGVGGGSAGGHLSLLLGLSSGIEVLEGTLGDHADQSSHVDAIVDLFGPADLVHFQKQNPRFRSPELAKFVESASPIHYLDSDAPPILIFHGQNDQLVPIEQSQRLVEACQKVNVPATLHAIEGAAHGGRQFSSEQCLELTREFLDKYIKTDSAASRKTMQGLWWMAGLGRALGADDNTFEAHLARHEHNLRENKALSGVYLCVQWKDIEQQDNQFNFDRLDRLIQLTREAGLDYKLGIVPGIYTPQFVYDQGAQSLQTRVSNPHRPNFGQPVAIPIPWDETFQRYFTRAVNTLADRYAGDPHFIAVSVTGPNFMSPELHLPRLREDIDAWSTYPDYDVRIEAAWKKSLDLFAEAFPDQQLCLELALPMKGMEDEVIRIIDYAIQHWPSRITLQSDQLSGRNDNMNIFSYRTILDYADRLHHGFQNVAGWEYPKARERQGTIEQTLANFKHAKAQYLELWYGDGVNPNTCSQILQILDWPLPQ